LTRGIGVVELLRTMPAREWSGWVAFSTLEPFGPRQEDQRAAYTVQAWAGSKVDVTSLFPSLATIATGSATWKSFAAANCPALAAKLRAAH
jgi:hypothetical protein